MNSTNTLTDIVVYSFLAGMVLLMTRPGSQGPALVNSTTSGYANIVKASTGQG